MGIIQKQQVKEAITESSIEEVVVTEKGTDELKKIKKAELYSGISGFLIPGAKYYYAIITQSGTNAPTVKVYKNDFEGDIIYTYDAVGRYTGTLTGAFPVGSTVLDFTHTGDDGNFTGDSTLLASGFNDANSFYINSGRIAPATGIITLANGWLYNTLITVIDFSGASEL